MPMKVPFPPRRVGFSLIELLVVITMIALLGTFALGAFSDSLRAVRLSATVQAITDHLNIARATAVTRNAAVEVRFYRIPSTDTPSRESFAGMRLFVMDRTPPTPLSRAVTFPEPVHILENSSYSSLLSIGGTANHRGTGDFDSGRVGEYVAFRFRPNGSTDLPTDEDWFITLISTPSHGTDDTTLPDNFASLIIHPLSGKVTSFQPR